jgi:hypothetical protein
MIGIIAAAAGVAAVPIAGGVAYRKSRQRKVAQALVINTQTESWRSGSSG